MSNEYRGVVDVYPDKKLARSRARWGAMRHLQLTVLGSLIMTKGARELGSENSMRHFEMIAFESNQNAPQRLGGGS